MSENLTSVESHVEYYTIYFVSEIRRAVWPSTQKFHKPLGTDVGSWPSAVIFSIKFHQWNSQFSRESLKPPITHHHAPARPIETTIETMAISVASAAVIHGKWQRSTSHRQRVPPYDVWGVLDSPRTCLWYRKPIYHVLCLWTTNRPTTHSFTPSAIFMATLIPSSRLRRSRD